MSRPLLNLSIVELTGLFEDSADKLNVNLDLLKELRHRSTPKAAALNKRVMAVIAQNASYAVLQSLHVPELEALATDCDDKPSLRASLIEVLQTRGSAKAQRLLETLTNVRPKSEAAKLADIPEKPEISAVSPKAPAPPSIQKPALFGQISPPLMSLSRIPPNVEQAFLLFELSTMANWVEIEAARQRYVTKYRPGSGFDNVNTSTALKKIAEAYSVLADYMKNKN